jgi:hypothetical protein
VALIADFHAYFQIRKIVILPGFRANPDGDREPHSELSNL